MLRFKTDEGIEFPNCKRMKMKDIFVETLYLIFDYPYKYYTFKHFEV